MSEKRIVSLLVMCILLLALLCVIVGLFSDTPIGQENFTSVHGEQVALYGKGIYGYDSLSMAVQGKAQDLVTGVIGLPLLLAALLSYRKNSFRGRMLLTGTVGYFLYTYVSCTFLWQFNILFPAYVALMSISLSTFILLLYGTRLSGIREHFRERTPVRLTGWFEIIFALLLLAMWTGRLLNAYKSPEMAGLEHYTTFVIQAMDLGLVVPAALIGGALLLRRRPLGYLISSVILVKGLTLGLALAAMMLSLGKAGMGEPLEFAVFGVCIMCLILLFLRWMGSMTDVRK